MEIQKRPDGFFQLLLQKDELVVLNNALNEVCNALPLNDFETRIGAKLVDVERLLLLVGQTLDRDTYQ